MFLIVEFQGCAPKINSTSACPGCGVDASEDQPSFSVGQAEVDVGQAEVDVDYVVV